MANESYLTLTRAADSETAVRGSRFIAVAFPAEGEEQARVWLRDRERLYFDARHHCAAWRFRNGVWRALDAGEPSGSAGPPILAAIDACGVDDVGVVVSRYFGGTKLGIGGLSRAYGEAASAALAAAPKRFAVPAVRSEIHFPFAWTAAVMRALEICSAGDLEHGFTASGTEAIVRMTVPRAEMGRLRTLLLEQTGGAVSVDWGDATTLYRPC